MNNYKFEMVTNNDISKILEIYNSNTIFLKNHLGISTVSKEFLIHEIEKMKNMGFQSLVIINNKNNVVGVCDFKISEEIYLSLLMIDSKQRRKGLGSKIYNQLEEFFKSYNAKRVRIDVVYDYENNAVAFWEKQGFIKYENLQLEWNG